MIDDEGRELIPCAAPRCRSGPVPVAALHVTRNGAFCPSCCPHYGSIGCEECWPDFDDDDDE